MFETYSLRGEDRNHSLDTSSKKLPPQFIHAYCPVSAPLQPRSLAPLFVKQVNVKLPHSLPACATLLASTIYTF